MVKTFHQCFDFWIFILEHELNYRKIVDFARNVDFPFDQYTHSNHPIATCHSPPQKDRHIQYVDLYKFVLSDQQSTNKEVEKFLEDVQSWEILSHSTKDRIVSSLTGMWDLIIGQWSM